MRNRRKEQAAKEEIVRLKRQEREIQRLMKQAYINLYLALGYGAEQAEKMI